MPTKHIDDVTWRKIEKEHVKAVIATQKSLKDTDILRILINKGLETINEDDYQELIKRK
ncbi:hypothetical protein JFJ09_05450 [Pseudoalteromonas arctica]|uniref:hypothetical protein n=1 Tax=Pseudoalteromonas arctica TaxID=394751 RepID=UPI001C9C481E|nr:hypothetical protein [Pseudoalteromonas arctica]MBZ2191652.1 hypothetical protein [Pseudoalteromonas arctica]MBZ2191659.1 hypothetical protein [Pseudoalteromonas arctica]